MLLLFASERRISKSLDEEEVTGHQSPILCVFSSSIKRGGDELGIGFARNSKGDIKRKEHHKYTFAITNAQLAWYPRAC